MKTSHLQNINTNCRITIYGRVQVIATKLTRQGSCFYICELRDKSGKIEFVFQSEFPIARYDFTKHSIRLHIQIEKRAQNSKVYVLTRYQAFQKSKVSFVCSTDEKPCFTEIKSKDVLLVNNHKRFSIHWKLALKNITYFEEYVNDSKTIEVHVYGLDLSKIKSFKKIFQFISEWGHLIL